MGSDLYDPVLAWRGVHRPGVHRTRESLLARAAETGAFLGVDENAYPRDFATLIRYQPDLTRHLSIRRRMRKYVSLEDFERLLAHFPRHAVTVDVL